MRPTNSKHIESEELALQIEEFKAKGGEIKQCDWTDNKSTPSRTKEEWVKQQWRMKNPV